MLIVLISILLSISTCKRPDPIIYPIDQNSMVVGKLPNGNWEVKEGLVLNYLKALAENKILKAKIKELEK